MTLTLPFRGPAVAGRDRGRRTQRRPDTLLAAAGPLVLAAALLLDVLAPGVVRGAAAPLAVAGILVGVPHGAVDHMVPFWLARRRPGVRDLAPVLGQYLVVAAAAAAVFLAWPDAAFTVFLAASVVHFGRAEVQSVAERAGRPAVRRDREWLRTLAHGLTVIAVPFAVHPDEVRPVVRDLAPSLVTPGAEHGWLLLGAAAAVLTAACAVGDLLAGRRRELAEGLLLLTAVAVLPALVSFGLYFGAWHALRHTGRLLALPGRDGRPLTPGAAWRRYALHATPPTLVVVVALGLLATHASAPTLGVALAVVLALTFPHMRVVAAWDRSAAAAGRPAG